MNEMIQKLLVEITTPMTSAHSNIEQAHEVINSMMLQVETGRLKCSESDKAHLIAMLAIVQMAHEVFGKAAAGLRALAGES